MPAGGVVELCRTMQAELTVEERADKFGCVDHAALQRGKDFAGGKQPHIDPKRLVDAPGQPWDAHLQASEVFHLLDRLLEPAGHLHAGVAAEEGHKVEAIIRLAPER